jgi:hypothetical protein
MTMLLDWPFGTVCAILIYIGLIYIVSEFLKFVRVPCKYEFEILTK